MAVKDAVRRYAVNTGQALHRAPVECLLTVCAAALLSYAIEDAHIGDEVAHLMVAMFIAGAIAWSATLANAMTGISDRRRAAITIAGAVAGTLYLFFTNNFGRDSESWRALMLVVGVVLLAFATPALITSSDATASLRIRRVNARFFVRAAGIGLYGFALFGGLAVALGAIDNLFALHIRSEIYGHVFIWIMVVLVPWVVIGGLEDYVRPMREQSEVARVVYRLSTFLLPPLVALYFLILCAYTIRIAITHELPANLVSPMVIAAGLLSAAALIVFDPPPQDGVAFRWLRFTPVLFVVLAPLAWYALHVRNADYGWTEFRLLRMLVLVVLAVLACGGIAQLVRKRAFPLHAIPVALAVSLIVCAIGPWSIPSVARRNQQHRLRATITAAGLDPAMPMTRDTTNRIIATRLAANIDDAASYLQSSFGPDAVTAVVPAYRTGQARSLSAFLHVAPAVNAGLLRMFSASMRRGTELPVPAGTVMRIDANGSTERPRLGSWISHDSVFIGNATETLFAALKPALDGASRDEQGNATLSPISAAVPVRATNGTERGYLTVLDITATRTDTTYTISHLSGILTLKGRTP